MIFSSFFKSSLKITLKHEGGYSNDSDDSGGETYKGIARNYWGVWEGWDIIDVEKNYTNFEKTLDNNKTLQRMVEQFYNDHFWKPLKLNRIISQKLAQAMFDKGINLGIKRVSCLLQESLNTLGEKLVVDGKLGSKSISAINKYKRYKGLVLKTLKGELYIFYKGITIRKPSQLKYIKGWIARI